jgi:hypothetical protein
LDLLVLGAPSLVARRIALSKVNHCGFGRRVVVPDGGQMARRQ